MVCQEVLPLDADNSRECTLGGLLRGREGGREREGGGREEEGGRREGGRDGRRERKNGDFESVDSIFTIFHCNTP